MKKNKNEGEDLYIDVESMEPSNNDEELWNSANMLVNELGYQFNEIVNHLGIPAEKLRTVIKNKLDQKSNKISKAFEEGSLTSEEFEKSINEISSFSKKIGKL